MRSAQGVIKEWEKGLGAALKAVIGKNKRVPFIQSATESRPVNTLVTCTQAQDFRRRQKIPWAPLNSFIASGKSYMSLSFFICKRTVIPNRQGY